jgi:predicted sulfurtransferase
MQIHPKTIFLLGIIALFTFTGCTAEKTQTATAVKPTAVKAAPAPQAENVLKGKIAGKSNKAKSISITVGKGDKAKTVMLKFDDTTKGLEFARKGEAAIIKYEMKGKDKFATVIKPKLAKLPAGVTEIKTEELSELYENGADMVVIDSRPASRYAQAHLPSAISIPVPKLKKEKEAVLPANKEQLLVLYCGGPT